MLISLRFQTFPLSTKWPAKIESLFNSSKYFSKLFPTKYFFLTPYIYIATAGLSKTPLSTYKIGAILD